MNKFCQRIKETQVQKNRYWYSFPQEMGTKFSMAKMKLIQVDN